MAAVNRRYNTESIDPKSQKPIVSFVGGQNTQYFRANVPVPSGNLLAGTLAQAAQADMPDVSFYDVYHELYGVGEPVQPDDDQATQVSKTLAYFTNKLFFNAARCLRQRDRFVIYAKRVFGDQFFLAGRGWQEAYGISTAEPFGTSDSYLNHFRESAINLNLVNGNAETGLNMRHFEITAAGGFMLCYHQAELENHFEVGKECVVFRSENELVEKIRYYLSHPEERVAIARAGQLRTLSDHLYSHRLATVLAGVTLGPLPVEYSKTEAMDDMKALLPEPRVILDCGANVGQSAASFRRAFPQADIYSFEPVRAVFQQLQSKCEEVGVHAVRKAVGDRDGQATIHLTASPEASSLLGFQEGNPCAKWTKEVGEEVVDICTLDRWCRDSEVDPHRVDLLKLDVQGGELKALHGAKALLRSVRMVYLEVSFVPMYKDSPLHAEIDSFMGECGFRQHGIYPSDQPHHWGDALFVKT
ncbi:MAG: FkbM family methyltransferase [Planctomycetes bacterium]|nr:FkbM family methyltransferase [Planctomycetota bacterium]